MLKRIRVALALPVFAGICLLFVDVSGMLPAKLAFLAKLQLVPAILSGSLAVVAGIAIITLVFGRVYCSVICPLGLLQDAVSHFGKKNRFSFSRNRIRLRAGALALFVTAFLVGMPLIYGLLEPYSAFGRIMTNLSAPVWQAGNNILAMLSEKSGDFRVAETPIWLRGASAFAAAVITLLLVAVLAWKGGRIWCNTVCPVGAVLGFLAKFSLLKHGIVEEKCEHCGLCAKNCKAACIDPNAHSIDFSRCVSCFNCLEVCRKKAIVYAMPNTAPFAAATPGKPDMARRGIMVAALGVTGLPAYAAAATRDKPVPALVRNERKQRGTPVIPPGASDIATYMARCTACQLCVSSCKNDLLGARDSGADMLQPVLSFERGYCRVNCVECSSVCPTGAIRPITVAEKSAIQIGRAVVDWERCIVNTDEVECTACSRNCPPGAITLVGKEGALKQVVVDAERCTGCGACEYYCPVRPLAAIRVEGNLRHRRI